jgi:hypothetical protein
MSWLTDLVRRSVLPIVFLAGIAVIAWFPSKESIGCATDRLIAWWSPRPKHAEQATLRVTKARFVGRNGRAGRKAWEAAVPTSVSPL